MYLILQAHLSLVLCYSAKVSSPIMLHAAPTKTTLVTLLSSLALIHAANNLRFLIINLLVDLGTPRRLVAVHPGGQGRVVLAGNLLGGLDLAAAVGGVVLVVCGGKTVGYAALVLCLEVGVSVVKAIITRDRSFESGDVVGKSKKIH